MLLKNERGALPLERGKVRSVAVIGPDADKFKSGGGSSNVTPYQSTTPLQGIRAAAGSGRRRPHDDGSDPARAARVAGAPTRPWSWSPTPTARAPTSRAWA